MRWLLLVLVIASSSAAAAEAGEGGEGEGEREREGERKRWSAGLVLGSFDADTDDGDDPHLNEVSYGVVLSYQPSRFWALDAEYSRVEFAREYDDFGVSTSFGARVLGLSGRIMWPVAEDFSLYLRTGLYQFDTDDQSVIQGALWTTAGAGPPLELACGAKDGSSSTSITVNRTIFTLNSCGRVSNFDSD